MKKDIFQVVGIAFVFMMFLSISMPSPGAASPIPGPTKEQKALDRLAHRGDVAGVQQKLAAGIQPHPKTLLYVVDRGKLDMLRMLIDSGLDISAPIDILGIPKMSMTLLGKAVEAGRADMVKMLLEAGADPAQPYMGRPVAAVAIEKGDAKIFALLTSKAGTAVLEQTDGMGWTPLHHAVMDGKLKTVRFLLARGANPNVKDDHGETPLHWAARKGNPKIVEMLLKAGADPNAPSNDGSTPLFSAAMGGSGKVIRALLSAGADPDVQDKRGSYAADYAKGVDAVVEALTKASRVIKENQTVPLAAKNGVYPPGTVLSGPCSHTGAIPEDAGCGSSGTEVTVGTIIRTGGFKGAVSPPLCRPVKVPIEGKYTVTVYKIIQKWHAKDCYKLKAIRGSGKQLVYFAKKNHTSQNSFSFNVSADAPPPPPGKKRPPKIHIKQPAANSQFFFDDSGKGVLEIGAEAVVEGDTSAEEVTWEVDKIGNSKTTISPEKGEHVTIRFEGLPDRNADFGDKMITASTSEGVSDSVDIQVFFDPLARNHPRSDTPTPNWFYYWGQTRAGRGFNPVYQEHSPCQAASIGSYVFSDDRTHLYSTTYSLSCIKRNDNSRAKGIDCYAETLRHEKVHEQELKYWWNNLPTPLGVDMDMGPVECDESLGGVIAKGLRNKLLDIDSDGDWVPNYIEDGLAGCDSNNPISCPGIPQSVRARAAEVGKDKLDVDMNSYRLAWKQWPIGRADREDWSRCGKQWKDQSVCRPAGSN